MASAEDCGFRPQDTLWLIDARHAGCEQHEPQVLEQLHFSRLEHAPGSYAWRPSTAEAFLDDPAPRSRTLVWVHGNRVDSAEALHNGLAAYRALAAHAPDETPLRLVIWSWPSSQVRGPLNDVRLKAALATPAAFQLAVVLDQMPPDEPVGLMGFSYGARVIAGALHLTAGGSFGAYRLARGEPGGAKYSAVLLASAMHDDWLLPGRTLGRAVERAERLLLVHNSCDFALKMYHVVDPCEKPCALGYWGLASPHELGPALARTLQYDAHAEIGREHSELVYLCNMRLMRFAWSSLTGEGGE